MRHAEPDKLEETSQLESGVINFGNGLSIPFLISVFIAVYEVIARFVFNSPTIWAHELTVFFCGICLAYGGLYCLAKKSHISIDIVYEMVSKKSRYFLDIFVETAQAIFFGAFSFASIIMVKKSWLSPSGVWRLENSGSAFNLPTPALLKAVILICAILMFIMTIYRLVRLLRQGLPVHNSEV